jgi:hypothetical protein
MIMGKEKLIPVLAIIVLLLAVGSTLYVQATKTEITEENAITINGNKYCLNELFDEVEKRTIQIDGDEISGIALDSLIEYSGVLCGSCNTYTIKATHPSPYQQTVKWDNMQKGILTDYSRVYFPDLARAFWVYNVVEIEVK